MIKALIARLKQGHRTIAFPGAEPVLPDRFRGRPALNGAKCVSPCDTCVRSCPTGAIRVGSVGPELDMGRCLFCTECTQACPTGAITLGREYSLAARRREDLILDGRTFKPAEALGEEVRRLFGRSLRLRQVSAGGCNACEADLNVLTTVVFDLGRFGIQFVASPRHADGLVITGPVTENMKTALLKTYEATPAPKFVIAVGACAISGGPYVDRPESSNGAAGLLPIDLFIPGCPPHPVTILDGLLRFLGQREG
ncbi:MAG: 4Fe-4S binding protein [Phycisphaerae bacterium]|nr:4Fe-4S binding protein [Phycisphaerae bacterium]